MKTDFLAMVTLGITSVDAKKVTWLDSVLCGNKTVVINAESSVENVANHIEAIILSAFTITWYMHQATLYLAQTLFQCVRCENMFAVIVTWSCTKDINMKLETYSQFQYFSMCNMQTWVQLLRPRAAPTVFTLSKKTHSLPMWRLWKQIFLRRTTSYDTGLY